MKKEKIIKTMRELAKVVDWKKVKKAMRYHYGYSNHKWEGYKPVFEKIRDCRKRKHKDPKEFIEICIGGFRDNDEKWLEDYGLEEYYSCHSNKYSLSFRKWNELINMPISSETRDHYTYEDMLAHFIWEITWYGTEEDARKLGKELQETVKKATTSLKKNGRNTRKS